ncbi:hypothetical protein MK851_12495 [Tenacibaculum sp. 1B UA]|uniref:hypothetical protein n=1 Tax=Tenacibaculum sp. 1B UA TaxID=2922252 RepID=UPI002A242455|nr:hypothetical protein [Tenacibaculum sp. 1B UA]MDX8554437.1 hypothetical protein [Tenacibaculum sp. 1B UA]
MKLPENIDKITLIEDKEIGPFPPNGFQKFEEASFGNGDYFGLYWEFGKEHQEPIICEILHDEGIIMPRFSCLNKFLEWYQLNDYDWGEDEIDDDAFVLNLIKKGGNQLKQSQTKQALAYYKQSTDVFGEYSENWYKLALLHEKDGNQLEFQKSIINAIFSNWAIQHPSENALYTLKNIHPVGALKQHPLIKNRNIFDLHFGGVKENKIYTIISEILSELNVIEDIDKALIMEQNYALMMHRETTSFQERYHFNLEQWQSDFKQKTNHRLKLKQK